MVREEEDHLLPGDRCNELRRPARPDTLVEERARARDDAVARSSGGDRERPGVGIDCKPGASRDSIPGKEVKVEALRSLRRLVERFCEPARSP